ncbi:MAG: protein jag [Oscillospiraceae bacterium]|nr:protein jag [Oscillospiraceae bacterium]
MIREVIETGKTVEEALAAGREKIGNPNAEFEILETPKKGLFGFRTTPAKVRVFVVEEEKPQPVQQAAPVKEAAPAPVAEHVQPVSETAAEETKPLNIPQEKIDIAVNYLNNVLTTMGTENYTITPVVKEDSLCLALECEDLGFIIGRRGETLDALQYLTGLVVNRSEGDYIRVTLDCGNFREKREKTLEGLAKRLSKNVLRSGRSITLEPMNPYERRTIHATVAAIEGVTSSSIGEEPNRRVVIASTNPRKPRYNKNGGGGHRGGYRDGGRRGFDDNKSRGGKGGFNKGRAPHKERTAPYEPKTVRENPPSEAKAVETQLYGKVEL